jgi:hypothetical protein
MKPESLNDVIVRSKYELEEESSCGGSECQRLETTDSMTLHVALQRYISASNFPYPWNVHRCQISREHGRARSQASKKGSNHYYHRQQNQVQ